jgi:membrane protein DedA with SNARE-associated domain
MGSRPTGSNFIVGIEVTLLNITQDLGIWAYLILALLVVAEGPVATLAGSVAASAGYLKPIGVFFAASSGNMLADCMWYFIGYLGKIEWVHRYGSYVGVRRSMVARVQHDVQVHAPKLLLIAKLTLGFAIPTLLATGLARVPIRRWFWVLLVGETIWTGILVALGYTFGQYVTRLERGVELVALGGGLVCVTLVLFYLSRVRKRYAAEEQIPEDRA